MKVTIYARDFGTHADDGESLFYGVLSQLGITAKDYDLDMIDEVTLEVSDYTVD